MYYYPVPVTVQIGNQVREIVAEVTFEDSVLFPMIVGLHTMALFDMRIQIADSAYQVCDGPSSVTSSRLNITFVEMVNDFDYILDMVNLTRSDLLLYNLWNYHRIHGEIGGIKKL